MNASDVYRVVRKLFGSIDAFSRYVVRRPLHEYQLAPARAIVDSVLRKRGLEFAILFPRQSGKNETQAQVEAYLLSLFRRVPGAAIVKAQPTFKPQALNARVRLETALSAFWTPRQWRRAGNYIIQLGEARVLFFSARPSANTVGATASVLLECDEAQDVLAAEWQRKFVPMGASTNVTVVYWGTAWTRRTLLAQAIRYLREQEQQDGIQRVFVVGPDEVARANPAYGEFVARQVARFGRQHPLVKTQFFNEEIEAEGGMFPPARRALMQGRHLRQSQPAADRVYAMLLDVAGEDEGAGADRGGTDRGGTDRRGDAAGDRLANPRRDSTALTIVEVDLATLADPLIAAPTFRCVDRRLWTGVKHVTLYAQLRALAQLWRIRYLVADATGVGAGLVAFLTAALGGAPSRGPVIAFEFNAATKSQLGWDFLALCDTGRWQDWAAAPGAALEAEAATFWQQLEACQYEVLPGPAHTLRWGVPAGTLDPGTGELVHDDLVLSAALAAVLDKQAWVVPTGPATILPGRDPLAEMSRGY